MIKTPTVVALAVAVGLAVLLVVEHHPVSDPGIACAQFCAQGHGWVVEIEGRPGEIPTCTCSTWRLSGEGEYHIDACDGPVLETER